MFKRSRPEQRGPAQVGGSAESCPKCGAVEVLGDYCQRCRVKVSTYQMYLASLGKGAQRSLAKRRSWFVFKSPVAPPAHWRASYEDVIQQKIYRELHNPATAPGVYLVLLIFHVNAAGRAVDLRLSVEPPNLDVAWSVHTAVDQAQPFPLPRAGLRGSEKQRVTLALTVSI